MPCPVCGAQTKRLFQNHGAPIHECKACQHRYAMRSPVPEPATSSTHNTVAATSLADAEVLQRYGWRYAELFKAYMPLGTVLDVSTAAGFTLKGMLEYGWYGVGLEPNRRLVDYGRSQLGLPIVPGSIEQPLGNAAKKAAFDLVMMVQSIANFQDLHQALANAAVLTQPNGFWYIETWDRTSWPAQWLGRHWYPANALHWFSPTGLAQLGEQYGFVEVARGRPQKWRSVAQMKSNLQEKGETQFGWQLLQTPLALLPEQIKIPQPSFGHFWMLLQKRAHQSRYSIPMQSMAHSPQRTPAVALNWHNS